MAKLDNILDNINNMTEDEIHQKLLKKAKHHFYIFEFDNNDEYNTIKDSLKKFKLFKNDHSLSVNNIGYIYLSIDHIHNINNGNDLPDYAVYSSGKEFYDNGELNNMYPYLENKSDIIKFEDFHDWLNNFVSDVFDINPLKMYSKRKFIYENVKTVKKYGEFILENKIPELSVGIEELLNILDGNRIDIFRKFRINKDAVDVDADLNTLYTDSGFNDNIEKNELKKGKLQNTLYNETLLDDKYTLKFFFLYNKDSIELEEPEFIILQFIDNNKNKRSDIVGYTNTDSINDFYERLTDATVELTKKDKNYIYQTSNGGNNWVMRNVQMEDETMKGSLDKKELQELINKNNLKVKNARVQ